MKRKIVAAVCHALCVLLNTKNAEGQPLIADAEVTGFLNVEDAVKLQCFCCYAVYAGDGVAACCGELF